MHVLLYVHSMCIYAEQHLQLPQHNSVRPVLKHGPRSLVHVQVRSRDRPVHNKCNSILNMGMCRQQINRKLEH